MAANIHGHTLSKHVQTRIVLLKDKHKKTEYISAYFSEEFARKWISKAKVPLLLGPPKRLEKESLYNYVTPVGFGAGPYGQTQGDRIYQCVFL